MAMSPYPEDDLRHPEEWEQIEGIRVRDPDGWRDANLPWETPISYAEFLDLAGASTVEVLTVHEHMVRLRSQTNTLTDLLD